MMFDSVREELQTKISSAPAVKASPKIEMPSTPAPTPNPTPAPVERPVIAAQPPVRRVETANLSAPKTSPTLVGFQNKNAKLPDWRIQLQNAVQQRKGGDVAAVSSAGESTQFPVVGATALKAEVRQEVEVVAPSEIKDPRVAAAMRRIEESRKNFQEAAPQPVKRAVPRAEPPIRTFDIVPPKPQPEGPQMARVTVTPRPTLVSQAPIQLKRDTNKLPPIVDADVVEITTVDAIDEVSTDLPSGELIEPKRIHIKADPEIVGAEAEAFEHEVDEIEDLAPLSMRFGAGLFDVLIGAFATMLLLSPMAFAGGDWFTGSGVVTFAASFAVVMFVYMTTCLGLFGKTMGMRLFSLELVDAVENEYPTMRQAAVNASVYMISLLFGGVGFLTMLFNEERRAAHDLASGTILVREF